MFYVRKTAEETEVFAEDGGERAAAGTKGEETENARTQAVMRKEQGERWRDWRSRAATSDN